MKKNALLAGVLVALLGVTYIFQEKKTEQKFEEGLVKDKLYPGEITQISVSGFDAKKENAQWKSGDILLSHNIFKQIEEKLRQIKKIKDVTGDAKGIFSSPVEFSVNNDKLVMGDMSLDRQGFYLLQNGKVMLAVLEGTTRELVEHEGEKQATKVNELAAMLSKHPKELVENQLFRFYPDLPFERVTIKIPDHLPFEIDLKNNMTSPPPFPGITAHEKLSEKFRSLLSQVTIKEEIPYAELGTKLGEMTFSAGGKGVMWELYTRNKKTADAVLVDPVRRKSWLMVGGTLRVFFIQLQDYWDKKNIPPEKFKSFTREPMTLTEGNLRTVVYVLNREPLEFEVQGYKVDKEKMLEVVSYAMNLGPLDQASRVSLLSNSERKQILSETHLRMEIFGEELLFWTRAEELIIVNLSQGFKSHFPRANVSGGFRFKDVLK